MEGNELFEAWREALQEARVALDNAFTLMDGEDGLAAGGEAAYLAAKSSIDSWEAIETEYYKRIAARRAVAGSSC